MCLPVSVFVLGLRAGVGDEGENGTTRGVETIIRFAPSRSVELGARLIRVERLRAVLLLLDIAVRRRLPKLRANLNLRRRGKSYVPGRAGPFSPAPPSRAHPRTISRRSGADTACIDSIN